MADGRAPLHDDVVCEGNYVVVRCPAASRSAGQARDILTTAEGILGPIVKQLRVPREILTTPRRIEVSVSDADSGAPAGSRARLDRDVVETTLEPGGLPGDFPEHLAQVVLGRAADADAAASRLEPDANGGSRVQRFLIEGAARHLVAHIGGRSGHTSASTEAALQKCHDAARANGWRLPVYQSVVGGPDACPDPALYRAMQEGFAAYLIDRDGPREFLRMLANAREDPNHAAEVMYGKSLELLEGEWLSGLRLGVGRRLMSLVEFARQVWPYLKPYPWRQVECLALMLIGSITAQVTPYQFRNIVDLLGNEQTKANPWGYGLPIGVGYIVTMLLAQIVNICALVRLVYVVNVLGQNILRDLRMAYIDRVNYFSAGYFARMRTGDLMARFVSDMVRLADPLAQTVAYSSYYIILMLVTLVSLINLSWQLTLLLVIVVPIYVFISRSIGPRIQSANRGRQERLAQINGHIGEMIYAHPIIQIFNLQSYFRRWLHPEIHEFRRVEIRSDFLRAVFEEISDIADAVQGKLVWTLGLILVLASFDPAVAVVIGSTTVGTVVAFNTLMGRFVVPVHRLANRYANIAVAAAAMRRIEEILKQSPEDMGVPANGTAEAPAVGQGITIEGVSFAYGHIPTLRDVSVSIPAGSSAAFVGPTGAGKTTLVNMIPRFYDPSEGCVRIDGRDVREFSLPALRGQISLVSQENFLFNTTIRENIALGKLDATDDEIVAAARAARIHDFISTLPAGYDTIVGERGTRLSGGQRQRLAIARALLRNAPILILDEATSALDAETESEILDELAEATRGKTTISITHRFALAMRADVIYVLEAGRIVEHGSHDELLALNGLYKKLFEDQNQLLLDAESRSHNGAAAGVGSTAQA
ncbi:MAG: ABC transporter ATP-binding protein [Chloroflexota bacterium]